MTSDTVKLGKRRAAKAGLYYVNDFDEGIARRRCGRGFTYLSPAGKTVKSKRTRKRIQSLVIPPAWQDVWICPKSNGHVQAKGVDDAGRMQYLYHEQWKAVSEASKFDRMHRFADLLPRIRRRVRKDLSREELSKERVIAAVVRLLDKAQLRVGNRRYSEARGSRGATTLTEEHVEVDGFQISLDFPGKSGQTRAIDFSDRKTAKVIRQCQDLDGQFLFCFHNDQQDRQNVTSSMVNDYLKNVAKDTVTAKDFRTWWGSVTALAKLADLETCKNQKQRNRLIRSAIKATARELGNTVAVCKSSYIHPVILAAAQTGELVTLLEKTSGHRDGENELTNDEIRFKAILPSLEFN